MYCNNDDQDKKEKEPDTKKPTDAREPESSPDSPHVVPLDADGHRSGKDQDRGRFSGTFECRTLR